MNVTKLILSTAVMSCLLSASVYSQEPDRSGVRAPESRLKLVHAEIEVKMRELELRMAELAVEEATLELEKLKLGVEAAQEQGDSRELAHAKLELRQAAIHVEMRKAESAMVRLRIQQTKAVLEHLRAERVNKERDQDPHQQQ